MHFDSRFIIYNDRYLQIIGKFWISMLKIVHCTKVNVHFFQTIIYLEEKFIWKKSVFYGQMPLEWNGMEFH